MGLGDSICMYVDKVAMRLIQYLIFELGSIRVRLAW